MARLVWLILFFLLTVAAAPVPDADDFPLYSMVVGGEEFVSVPPRTNLTLLSLEKGVQWQMVARVNELKAPYRLKAGTVLRIDNSHIVPTEMSHGLVINLPELGLYHFRSGTYQRRYALAVGKRTWQTPTGDFQILNKTRNPTWVVPASIQEEMEEQGIEVIEKVPPGPKNPLGAYWMGTSAPGVGLHATNRPWTVGNSVSHGCMRMLPDEIAELFPQIELGTPVKIIYRPVKLAVTPQGRIYLEAHYNIYRRDFNAKSWVEEMARRHGLEKRIDWGKVPDILKMREGIARDITKGAAPATAGRKGQAAAASQGPPSLQSKETQLE